MKILLMVRKEGTGHFIVLALLIKTLELELIVLSTALSFQTFWCLLTGFLYRKSIPSLKYC